MKLNSFEGRTEILGTERRVEYRNFSGDDSAELSIAVRDEHEAHEIIAFLESKKVAAAWVAVHPVQSGETAVASSGGAMTDGPPVEVVKRRRRRTAPHTNGHALGQGEGGLFDRLESEAVPEQAVVAAAVAKEPEPTPEAEPEPAKVAEEAPAEPKPKQQRVKKTAPVDTPTKASEFTGTETPADPEWMQDEAAAGAPSDLPEKIINSKRLIEVINYVQEKGAADASAILAGIKDLRPHVPLLNRIPEEQIGERVKRALEMYAG